MLLLEEVKAIIHLEKLRASSGGGDDGEQLIKRVEGI